MPGIYRILCKANGRYYIGSAVVIAVRWRSHRSHLRKGKHHCRHLQRAWVKYGETAFEFSVIEDGVSRSDLIAREQFHIDAGGCALFNGAKVAGSTMGITPSPETRAKIGEANRRRVYTAERNKKISDALRGRPKSPEHAAKVAAAQRGKKLPEAQRLAQIATLAAYRESRRAAHADRQ